MADDGNSYIVGRVGEVQGRYSGIAFMVGSDAIDGWSSSTALSVIRSGVVNDGGTLQGDLEFFTNSGDSVAERMKLTHEGKLGIGETSPDELLHIKIIYCFKTSYKIRKHKC